LARLSGHGPPQIDENGQFKDDGAVELSLEMKFLPAAVL
jgi:hypothetical protein